MGSNESKIEPTVLEEAVMYSAATHTDIKKWHSIFKMMLDLETMLDDHYESVASATDLTSNPTSDPAPNPTSDHPASNPTSDPTTIVIPSNIHETTTAPLNTMRYEEFCNIPEFQYHPLADSLWNFALTSEPYFEHETRLSFTKFSILLAVLAHNGSVEKKTRLAFFLITNGTPSNNKITRENLQQYLAKITTALSPEVLQHAVKEIFAEIKNNGVGITKSNPNTIDIHEYQRSVSVADDFASKICVDIKVWSTKQLLLKRKHKSAWELAEKEKKDKEEVERNELKKIEQDKKLEQIAAGDRENEKYQEIAERKREELTGSSLYTHGV